jgi:hypothetical protein
VGAENALGFTILWRSVWTRHPHNHHISGEECARGTIVKLTTIITLDDFDGAAKLCGDISKIFWQSGKSVRFDPQGKSPYKMGVIIKNNHIIVITQDTNNWRGPQITMD